MHRAADSDGARQRGGSLRRLLPGRRTVAGPPEPVPLPALARSRRVLVIEDEADSAESMRELLSLNGHEVEVARNGPAGIERAKSFRPEVVLCDIGLPEPMDGYAVARALRREGQCSTACLIALTGYGDSAEQLRTQEAGFHLHLVKPIEPRTLLRLILEA